MTVNFSVIIPPRCLFEAGQEVAVKSLNIANLVVIVVFRLIA
jgi:hypothetical protein